MTSYLSERISRLVKEGGWIIAGQIAAVIGSLLMVRMLTEHLDPGEYGQLALGMTIAGLVNQVAMGGLISGISRFYSIAAEKSDLRGYIKASKRLMVYATLGVGAIALFLIVGLAITRYAKFVYLAVAVLVFSILSGYNSALGGIQNAARQRAIVAMHGAMNAWLNFGLVTGMVLFVKPSSSVVVIGYALTTLLITLSQLFFLARLLHRHNNDSPIQTTNTEDWSKQIWMFSWPMMAGGLFNWGYYASQRWSLELFASTADVGKFYALTQIAYSPISMASGMFMTMLLPILYARAGDPGNHQRIANVRKIIFKIAAIGGVSTFLIAGIALSWHKKIFSLFVAEQYLDMSAYMPLTVLAAGLLQVSMAISIALTVKNKTRKFLSKDIFCNAIIATINLCVTWLYGLNGLLLGMLAGAILHLLWTTYIVIHEHKQS